MNRQHKFLALIAGTAIALSGSVFAASQSATPAQASKQVAATSRARGVVKTMDANTLVIEHKTKSGPKQITLLMNSDTQKHGDLKVGSHVFVQYRVSNNQDIATMVHVRQAKKGAAKAN